MVLGLELVHKSMGLQIERTKLDLILLKVTADVISSNPCNKKRGSRPIHNSRLINRMREISLILYFKT